MLLLQRINIRVNALLVIGVFLYTSYGFIIPYRAFENPDMEFYNQHGQLISQGDNRIFGLVEKDSITFKALFVNNRTVLKSVKDNRNCAMSITKYHKGELVIFDSLSPNCVSVVQFYKGIDGMEDVKDLPEYLISKPKSKQFYEISMN
jgi:hypothetical protein